MDFILMKKTIKAMSNGILSGEGHSTRDIITSTR